MMLDTHAPAVPPTAAIPAPILSRLEQLRPDLIPNAWVAKKSRPTGRVKYVLRWRARLPSGGVRQPTIALGADPAVAKQVRDLLHRWRVNQRLRPSGLFDSLMKDIRRFAIALELHPRGRRRLFALCAKARRTDDWRLLAAIMDDPDGQWLRYIVHGRRVDPEDHGCMARTVVRSDRISCRLGT